MLVKSGLCLLDWFTLCSNAWIFGRRQTEMEVGMMKTGSSYERLLSEVDCVDSHLTMYKDLHKIEIKTNTIPPVRGASAITWCRRT